jgi:hypothetical protein
MSEEIPRYGGRYVPSAEERAALDRLLTHARENSDQGLMIRRFLLAWADASDVTRFAAAASHDMAIVSELVAKSKARPRELGYGKQFEVIASLG